MPVGRNEHELHRRYTQSCSRKELLESPHDQNVKRVNREVIQMLLAIKNVSLPGRSRDIMMAHRGADSLHSLLQLQKHVGGSGKVFCHRLRVEEHERETHETNSCV